MRKTLRLWSILLAVVMTLTLLSTTAFAAVKKSSYGWIFLPNFDTEDWEDENWESLFDGYTWYAQYYKYQQNESAHEPTDYAHLRGNNLLDKKGKLIYNDVKEMETEFDNDTDMQAYAEDHSTFGFDKNGYFYFITEDGQIAFMKKTTDTTYQIAKSISNAKYFEIDGNELITKVVYSNNDSSTQITKLTFSGSKKRSQKFSSSPTDNLPDEAVFNFVYDNDQAKIGYVALYDGEPLIEIYAKANNVWVESENFLLSDSSVGPKFVAFSKGYQTVRYEADGYLHITPYGMWNKTFKIKISQEIMSFKKDDNGFLEYIVTSNKTYDFQELLEENGYDRYDFDGDVDDDDDDIFIENISYVERSSSKAVAYQSNGTKLATITKQNNYLYYDGSKLENSYKASYFSFTKAEGYIVWINNNDELYYYDGNVVDQLDEDVDSIIYNSKKFATEYEKDDETFDFDF